MTAHPSMNDVFQRLDKWRHFAGFPLEARSEVLFAVFLPTVLEAHFKKEGIKIKPQVIPQFPLKREDSNQSNNVDFFALSEDGEKGFLIELKTDVSSRRTQQDEYLTSAAKKCMDKILCDLKSIVQASTEKKKYYHLLNALCELDLISLAENLESKIYPENSRGLKNAIDKISILNSSRLVVVYVQPREHCDDKPDDKHHYLYFDEFADYVESQGDMGGLFAGYLRKWIEDPAEQPPRRQ